MKAQHKIIKLKDPCRWPNARPTVHGQNVLKRAQEEPALPPAKAQRPLSAQESMTVINVQRQIDNIRNDPSNHDPEALFCDDNESVSSGELWRPEYSPYSPADSE